MFWLSQAPAWITKCAGFFPISRSLRYNTTEPGWLGARDLKWNGEKAHNYTIATNMLISASLANEAGMQVELGRYERSGTILNKRKVYLKCLRICLHSAKRNECTQQLCRANTRKLLGIFRRCKKRSFFIRTCAPVPFCWPEACFGTTHYIRRCTFLPTQLSPTIETREVMLYRPQVKKTD